MPPKKKAKVDDEEFTPQHDHMPKFLESLDDLVKLYKEKDDFRAKSFETAREALEGQIITSVDDIKLFKLKDIKGVGKSTLECLEEFIKTGRIERLQKPLIKRYVELHPPLRIYTYPDEPVELSYKGFKIVITSQFYQRDLTKVFDFDLRACNDLMELKAKVEKYESETNQHDPLFFEGYVKTDNLSDVKTIAIGSHLFKNDNGILWHCYGNYPFLWHCYSDDHHNELKSLDWTPDGLREFLMEELMIDWRWEKLFCKPKPQKWKPFKTLKLYPDEEEEPDVWWDVKPEFRLEAYDLSKGFEDEYNTYRAWKGTVSREDKVATFRFVHNHMVDGDVNLESVEGDFPDDLCDRLQNLFEEELCVNYDSAEDYDSDEDEDDQSEEEEKDITFWTTAETDLQEAIKLLKKNDTLSMSDDGKLLLNGSDKESFLARGCPFTFEYEGNTYKVVGTVTVNAIGYNESIVATMAFVGTITKNEKDWVSVEVECEVEVSDGCVNLRGSDVECDTETLGFTEEDEENFLKTLRQKMLDEVFEYYKDKWELT